MASNLSDSSGSKTTIHTAIFRFLWRYRHVAYRRLSLFVPTSMLTILRNKVVAFQERNSTIYPIAIPSTTVISNLDILLLELPPRYMPMMPSGIGYVHNIAGNCNLDVQTIDLNIILFHRYHASRLAAEGDVEAGFDAGWAPRECAGMADPWDLLNIERWSEPEVLDYFWPHIVPLLEDICAKKPRALGLSVHGNNRALADRFAREVRRLSPDTLIIVGGYDCVLASVGPRVFPNFDYMVIGEAESSLPGLLGALAKGNRPRNLPGIVSRFDTSDRVWKDAPPLEDIDSIDFPRYEWIDVQLYRTYFDKHLVPIAGSRGCKWSRCSFCAECFTFRSRSPAKVVDEIEFMVAKGFDQFHFNESDLNGDPKNLYEICSEIIRRKLKIQMIGQLRINRHSTSSYFKHLAKAGFKHLRFGVDGWSVRTLRLQRKGYKMEHVYQNLRDCRASGIYTTVNVVIGVPGETENDVSEMVEHLINVGPHIDAVESINSLILAAGSDYYQNPDKHNIRFRGDKHDIYRQHPSHVPAQLWYSEGPYIDEEIRFGRLERICGALGSRGIHVGAFSSAVVERLSEKRAAERTCGAQP